MATRFGSRKNARVAPRRFVILGDTQIAGRACAALTELGHSLDHALRPSQDELRAALSTPVDGVIVLFHDDPTAMRYVLAVEHLRPGVPIWVALFDRTASVELDNVVVNLTTSSPAEVALPSLLAGVLGRTGEIAVCPPSAAGLPEPTALANRNGRVEIEAFQLPPGLRRAGFLGKVRGQLRPWNGSSAILLSGLAGLIAILIVDTLLLILRLDVPPLTALQEAVAVLATVGPSPHAEEHPEYQVFAIAAMLAAIILLAVFTAGLVDHLLTGRHIGLFGRRVMPRSGHVIVVGMGQVGLRLCEALKDAGVAVAGVERNPEGRNLSIARNKDIPVYLGDGSSRRTLDRLGVGRAVALAAVASDELDNIAVAITARALAPGVKVELRAGDHDAIAETASLFTVGSVVDVNALTVSAVAAWCAGTPVRVLADADDEVVAVAADETIVRFGKPRGGECSHVSGRSEPRSTPE